MVENICVVRNSDITDKEIVELRASVGWDTPYASFSQVKENLYTYFTARKNGKLIGFIGVLSDGIGDAYLQDLILRPDYQKMGIGTCLMKQAISYLKSQGIYAIHVEFDANLKGFYGRFGFRFLCAGIIER